MPSTYHTSYEAEFDTIKEYYRKMRKLIHFAQEQQNLRNNSATHLERARLSSMGYTEDDDELWHSLADINSRYDTYFTDITLPTMFSSQMIVMLWNYLEKVVPSHIEHRLGTDDLEEYSRENDVTKKDKGAVFLWQKICGHSLAKENLSEEDWKYLDNLRLMRNYIVHDGVDSLVTPPDRKKALGKNKEALRKYVEGEALLGEGKEMLGIHFDYVEKTIKQIEELVARVSTKWPYNFDIDF